jgi:hypothetical protein
VAIIKIKGLKMKIRFWLGNIEKIITVDSKIDETHIKKLFLDFISIHGGGYEIQELLTD